MSQCAYTRSNLYTLRLWEPVDDHIIEIRIHEAVETMTMALTHNESCQVRRRPPDPEPRDAIASDIKPLQTGAFDGRQIEQQILSKVEMDEAGHLGQDVPRKFF